MTVPSTASRADYPGNGVTTEFPVPFPVLELSHLTVTSVAEDGTETALTVTTDWTFAGLRNPSGTLTLADPADNPTGATLVIRRVLPLVQGTDLRNQGRFFAQTHEDAFDRATMMAQQLSEVQGRTLKLPVGAFGVSTTVSLPESNAAIAWDESATRLVNRDAAGFASVAVGATWRVVTATGDGATTSYALESTPGTAANTAVSVDGVMQTPGVHYHLSGDNLVFVEAPPNLSHIAIRYGTHVAEEALTIGDGVVTTTKIADEAVSLPKLAHQVPHTVIANDTTASAGPTAVEIDALTVLAAGSTTRRDLGARFGELINVRDFGAVGDGVHDDTAAIAGAMATGGNVVFPAGVYLVGGVTVRHDGQMCDFQGCTLRANANDAVLFRQAASDSVHRGRYFADANGMTGVWGMAIAPENLTQTTEVTHNNYNVMPAMVANSCAVGVALQAGPDVAGADSGCWYNQVRDVHCIFCTVGIWLRPPPNASGSGPNRNNFDNIRVGQGGVNTGILIDAGGTNTFYSCAFEGIVTGSTPSAVPTAVVVKMTDPLSGDNNTNRFVCCTTEACTRDLENLNQYTELYGCEFDGARCVFTALPGVCIGSDPSQMPQIGLGLRHNNGGLISGDESLAVVLPRGQLQFPVVPVPSASPLVLDEYREGTWTPELEASGMAGATYEHQRGRFVKIGRVVHVWCDLKLSGFTSTGGNYLAIVGLPYSVADDAGAPDFSAGCLTYESLTGGTVGRVPRAMAAAGTTAINLVEQDEDGWPITVFMSGTRLTTSTRLIAYVAYLVAD